MPARIRMARQRLVILKTVLRVLQLVAAEYLGTAAYGSKAGDAVLLCAIFIGQVEKRPMTAAKLADYAGVPRATVVRKLRAFEKRGLVEMDSGGRVSLPVSKLNTDGMVGIVGTASRSVHSASTELSKMDMNGVEPS